MARGRGIHEPSKYGKLGEDRQGREGKQQTSLARSQTAQSDRDASRPKKMEELQKTVYVVNLNSSIHLHQRVQRTALANISPLPSKTLCLARLEDFQCQSIV